MHPIPRTDCALLRSAAIVSILIVSFIVPSTNTFNVDTVNYVRHEGEQDSMFGFSVALHREQQRSWVIIGAPRADTSRIQEKVSQGGAVYRCDIFTDNRCHLIPFDQSGNHHNDNNEQVDTKSNQWFGATVSSAGEDGPLVACAPRYVFHSMQPRNVVRVEPVGTCFMAKKNFQEFTEYSPCRTMFTGYHKQGSCQAGLSAAITKNGERLFIGAPGSWYWQGQEYSINTDSSYPYKPPRYGQYGEGQTYSYSLNNQKDKVWATRESTAAEDDSYLGYSSVTGDFNGDGTQGVAVGMPRGGGLLGKVLLFSWNMTNQQNITGEQIGAYFGYSLAVVDVDGDKLDDLIVGAPMHAEQNNEGKYDMGRVYIIFQDKFNKFESVVTRDGLTSKGRFGLSLTSLGDINIDGYGDFAVGAPYDGPNGRGAVYIYHGSKSGPLEKPSQVIYAEDITGSGYLNTFGFSLSGGIDLDQNLYTDLVVGAYDASKAFVFMSRPVVNVEASTSFEISNKLISLDEKTCQTIRDRKQVTCSTVKSCLKYTGVNVPSQIEIEVSWVLDAKKPRSPRLFFIQEEGKNIRNSTMRLSRGKTECRTERVYIAENVRDKLTPLEVEMRYNMRETNQQRSDRNRRSLEPVINQNSGTVERDSINIQKNCGPDNVCIPDLRLEVQTVNTYLLGSKDLLTFDVKVSNLGEDAFEAGFFMEVPEGMSFRKIERMGESRDTPITCTAPSQATNHNLKCDIGNPLTSRNVANFRVILLPATKQGIAPKYDFYMKVNSTNAELEGSDSDNEYKKSVDISVETNLSVKGASIQEEILYNTTDFVALENATHESQIGPQVVHIYEIRNGGPSTIEEAEIFFVWPFETLNNDPLLYLLNQPETTKNMKCEQTQYANVQGVTLDKALATKSFLVSQGAVEKSSLTDSAQSTGDAGVITSSRTDSVHSTGYSVGGQGKHTFTEEEKKRFDDEEKIESTGDASAIHKYRQSQAAQEQGTGEYQHTASATWSSSNPSARLNQSKFSPEKYDEYSSQQRSGSYQQHARPNVHAAGFASGGVRKIEDFSAEGSVSQDLSSVRSHGQVQASQGAATTGKRRMMSQQDGQQNRPDLIHGVTQNGNKDTFHAGTIELNTLGRDNVDEEIRRHGNAAHFAATAGKQSAGQTGSSSSYHQSSSFSGGSGGQSSHHSSSNSFHDGKHTSTHAGNSNSLGNEYEEEEEEFQDGDEEYDYDNSQATQNQHQQTHLQQPQQHQYQQQQYRSFSNGNANGANQGFQHYQRLRRDLPNLNDADLKNRLTCNRSRCALIRCTTTKLDTDSSAWIALRMRLVTNTLNMVAPNVPLNISTMMVSRVSRLPYIGKPRQQPLKSHEVKIAAVPIPEAKPDIVPLWIIILSACIGVIILLLLIYLLYKCGFFKRNRPDHSIERQPLNRNNGYHGDERL